MAWIHSSGGVEEGRDIDIAGMTLGSEPSLARIGKTASSEVKAPFLPKIDRLVIIVIFH